jgi:PKD domain
MSRGHPTSRTRALTTILPIAILVLLALTTVTVTTSALARPGAGSPSSAPTGFLDTSLRATAVAPQIGCIGNFSNVWFDWGALSQNTSPIFGGTPEVGPAPGNVSLTLAITGPALAYGWYVEWGDGTNDSLGSVNANSTTGAATAVLTHFFALPAIYELTISVNYTCPGGSGGGTGAQSGPLFVYGSAGPDPILVTSNVTASPVPAVLNYTVQVGGAPAGASAQIAIQQPTIVTNPPSQLLNTGPGPNNSTSFDLALTTPGLASGIVQILYPGGSMIYAAAELPKVNVTPLDNLSVSSSSQVGSSPWNITWWANATNLSGAPYAGNGTIEWQFSSYPISGNGTRNPYFWAFGPDVGSPVWRLYFENVTGVAWPVTATANLVLPDGVTAATETGAITLENPYSAPTTLLLSSNVSNGTAPLAVELSAQLVPANDTNFSSNLLLQFVAFGINNVTVWNDSVSNWSGNSASVDAVFTVPGEYEVVAQAYAPGPGTDWTFLAQATVWLVALPSTASAPTITFSASPALGSAPLNVTMSFLAVGGTAPYSLSVCREGPFASTNGTGPCTSLGATSAWNGSAWILQATLTAVGNYTIYATITDSTGANSTAFTSVEAAASAPIAPLAATASYLAPNAISTGGATYGFVTTVTGGVVPYTIQWSFGDGVDASALPGSTILHTYTASGSFEATLTVTDARGTVVHTAVGPMIVTLPLAPSAPAPWWSLGWVLALATVLAGACGAVLGVTLQRIRERREALNWFRELEERPGSEGSVPRSR